MKAFAVIAVILLSVSSALGARFEVDCNFSNCAQEGWELHAWTGFYRSTTSCKAGGCFTTGYVTEDSNGGRVDVTCNSGNCWTAGWQSILYPPGPSRMILENVMCHSNDCLKYGWWTTSDTGETRQTQCLNNDCGHVGWVTGGFGQNSNTFCKMSNCFESGWTLDVY